MRARSKLTNVTLKRKLRNSTFTSRGTDYHAVEKGAEEKKGTQKQDASTPVSKYSNLPIHPS